MKRWMKVTTESEEEEVGEGKEEEEVGEGKEEEEVGEEEQQVEGVRSLSPHQALHLLQQPVAQSLRAEWRAGDALQELAQPITSFGFPSSVHPHVTLEELAAWRRASGHQRYGYGVWIR
ncbi:unnamed protein product [Lampetra planeri]